MQPLLDSLSYDHLHSHCESGNGSRLEKLYLYGMYTVLAACDEGTEDDWTFVRKKLKGKYARTHSVIEISDGAERLIIGRERVRGGGTYFLASSSDWFACWILLRFS